MASMSASARSWSMVGRDRSVASHHRHPTITVPAWGSSIGAGPAKIARAVATVIGADPLTVHADRPAPVPARPAVVRVVVALRASVMARGQHSRTPGKALRSPRSWFLRWVAQSDNVAYAWLHAVHSAVTSRRPRRSGSAHSPTPRSREAARVRRRTASGSRLTNARCNRPRNWVGVHRGGALSATSWAAARATCGDAWAHNVSARARCA